MIDYGIGNLFSLRYALQKNGLDAYIVPSTKIDLTGVDAVVLPGVGSFGTGAENLGLFRKYISRLKKTGIPIFGVCLGMQLLFESSEESYGVGLGLFKGRVLRLPRTIKTPHMGWNTLRVHKSSGLLDDIKEKAYFYFVHSFYCCPVNRDIIVAETEYGLRFASIVASSNIYGVQFHPEKSGNPGSLVLRNFASLVKC